MAGLWHESCESLTQPPDQAALVFTTAVVHLERDTCLELMAEDETPALGALLHRDDVGVRGAMGAERS